MGDRIGLITQSNKTTLSASSPIFYERQNIMRGCLEVSRRLSFDKISNRVSQFNYKLLEVVFGKTTRQIRITIQCPMNHIYETSWEAFRDGGRCSICTNKESGKKRRKPFSKICELFKSYDYEVLTTEGEYGGTHKKTKIKCINNHIRMVTVSHFKKIPNCPECRNYRYKYTIEEVRNIFEKKNCILLTDTYINNKSPLDYICPNGHLDKVGFYDFTRGVRCAECQGIRKFTLEQVKEIFLKGGCVLLSNEYKGNHSLLEYQCSCGNKSQVTLANFQNGSRCMKCYRKTNRGENHSSWNPLLSDEERINKRKFDGYQQWRKDVFKRDNYTCQCCGDNRGGNLNAHHKDGYNWCVEGRTDVNNGITLCDICHDDFHGLYGYGDNTEEQFNEWLQEIQESMVTLN